MLDAHTTPSGDDPLAAAPTRATDGPATRPTFSAPTIPGDGSHRGPRTTVLVVSQERVGRGFVVQSLRGLGLHTLVADSAGHALSRLRTGHQAVSALMIVGELSDGTAAALHRWARANGLEDLPILGLGVDLAEEDLWSRVLPTSAWFGEGPSTLVSLGLLERRAEPIRIPTGDRDPARATDRETAAPTAAAADTTTTPLEAIVP